MESIQKFQDLLKRLFQFETSDLDFGIYRILNYKRGRIEKFIQEDFKNIIDFLSQIEDFQKRLWEKKKMEA